MKKILDLIWDKWPLQFPHHRTGWSFLVPVEQIGKFYINMIGIIIPLRGRKIPSIRRKRIRW